MNETTLTIVGNLVADPELRVTPGGHTVASFTVASTPRVRDGDSWRDGDPLFLRCTLWRQPAEHAVESLNKGARVIATGRLQQRSYQTENGDKRTSIELAVDEIGPSLRYATTKVVKTTHETSSGNDEPPF